MCKSHSCADLYLYLEKSNGFFQSEIFQPWLKRWLWMLLTILESLKAALFTDSQVQLSSSWHRHKILKYFFQFLFPQHNFLSQVILEHHLGISTYYMVSRHCSACEFFLRKKNIHIAPRGKGMFSWIFGRPNNQLRSEKLNWSTGILIYHDE